MLPSATASASLQSLRTCPVCSAGFAPVGQQVYCAPLCKSRAAWAKRCQSPCAGGCGRLLGGGRGSLPEGQRRCVACRGRAPAGARQGGRPRASIGCANLACQATIEKPHGRQRWCSAACRHRVQDVGAPARARNARKNAKRRPSGLASAGSGWSKLRAQVLAEEPDCWICADPIDPGLRWPHPMSGTGDHVVPIEAGGAILDRANVRAAHRTCNQQRHVAWRRERRTALRAA